MAGPYDKLSDFCVHYSLDYGSIHAAFSKQGLIENKKLMVAAGVSGHEFQQHVSADKMALTADRVMEAVLHLVLAQVLHGALSLDKLMSLMQRLSTDRQKYGEQVIAAQAVASPNQAGTASLGGKKMSLLPPGLREAVVQKLANAGETLVKKQEQQKHG